MTYLKPGAQLRAARLSRADVRLIGLLFEGLPDLEICDELGLPHGTLRDNIVRLNRLIGAVGGKREVLVRFYIDHLIKDDLQGTPLDKSKESYTQPGQKLAEWTAWAVRQRELILADPNVLSYFWDAAMLLAKPENAGKSYAQLGRLVSNQRGGSGINPGTLEGYMTAIFKAMGGARRPQLFVVVTLTAQLA